MVRVERSELEFALTDCERNQLLAWSQQPSRVSVRARIILACSEPGVVYDHVAGEVGVLRMTVNAWRRRFAQDRLAG